jgi:hypothetical protein
MTPITYDAAMKLYEENGRKPFSFVAAPYEVQKTIVVESGRVLASPPTAAMAHYEWVARHRAARGLGPTGRRAR